MRLFSGLGVGGMDTGLVYGTLDSGLILSHELWNWLTPYATGFVALSVPFERGDIIDNEERPTTSVYGGGALGVAVRLLDSLFLSGELVVAPVLANAQGREDGTVAAGSLGITLRFR